MSKAVKRFPPLPTIQELIRLYRLRARKQLAQNFLLDRNLTDKIVRSAGRLTDGFVCEVGPGPGGITRSILNTQARHLVVVEKDQRFLPSLQLLADVSEGRMRVVHGDILQHSIESHIPAEYCHDWSSSPPNIHLIGNLPFNVATPLIIRWLEAVSSQSGPWSFGRTRMTLTFQKEVAERMVASERQSDRCRLSVMCQHLCDVKHVFTIPGKAFVPPPKVDVGVVHFIPRVEPLIKVPFKLVEKLNRNLFHHPNKHSRYGIRTLFPPDRLDLTARIFDTADINPEHRPRSLSVEQIGRLCQVYQEICCQEPELAAYDFRSQENAPQWRSKKLRDTETSRIEEQILTGSGS